MKEAWSIRKMRSGDPSGLDLYAPYVSTVVWNLLRVEAPEGVALPDLDPDADGYYQLFGMGAGEQISFVPEEGSYSDFGYNMDIDWLPDNDPAGNVKGAVFRFFADGEGTRFNDGVSKLLTIRGLWVQSPDKEYTEIFKGEFSFDLGLYYESKAVPLDCTGATWHNEAYGFTNTLEKLELSPLSLTCRFASTMAENDWVEPLLDLSQADYVQYGEHIIAVPAN